MGGSLSTSWHYDDKSAAAVVRRMWRILEKVTTTGYEGGPSMGPSDWFGHHALEWCRSDPKYMLNGNCHTWDHWEIPQNDWYQDLRRRVIARFGPDFGTPEPPEEPDDMPTWPGAFRLW